ncbi:BA75_02769T0 [Komagataella pastoris]|uniref:BA75_02769T0 n=1 Tax=Komagataella pastoris TaxID=4922 RepID=A0A1B2JD32_PICPA|nr:BA75_02769T0 [Komagataella pastoris]
MSLEGTSIEYEKLTFKDSASPLTFKKVSHKLPVSKDEIAVKVSAAGLNPVDLGIYYTFHPWVASLFPSYRNLGRDYSGTVVQVGSDLKSQYFVGDKVFGYVPTLSTGTLAQYLFLKPKTKHDASIVRVDQSVTDEQLVNFAGIPLVFLTTVQSLSVVPLSDKSRVVIIGGSTSLGWTAIQVLLNHYKVKPENLVSVNGSRSNNFVQELGVLQQNTINYDQVDSIQNPVLDKAKDGKFDLILDAAGNSDLFNHINEILKSKEENGHYVTLVGDHKPVYASSLLARLPSSFSSFKRFIYWNLIGGGPIHYQFRNVHSSKKDIDLAYRLYKEGNYKVIVDSIYSSEEVTQAYKRVESNQARGKVIVKF